MSYLTIVRKEVEELSKLHGWVIVYGRRKTGKTFMLRNLTTWNAYILIRRDLSIRSEEIKIKDVNDLVNKVGEGLKKGQTIIIDEFQRLPIRVLEDLTQFHPHGRLVLSGSSLRIIKEIFEPSSPLLGFFTPMKISLINPKDILSTLSKKYDPIRAVEFSTYLRDPWLIPLHREEEILEFVYKYTCKYWQVVKALVGEVFTEEERTLTRTYEAILSLMGAGVWQPKNIANILYARKIIGEPSSSAIAGYLKNLIEMDLIEAIKIYNSKRKFYRLKSPIMGNFYYLESKYEVTEREATFDELKPTLNTIIHLEIEKFIADLIAQIMNGRKEYLLQPEVDFIITVRGKPKTVGEVKWGTYNKNDIKNFITKTETIPGDKIFIVKKKEEISEKVKILDAEDLINLIKSSSTS